MCSKIESLFLLLFEVGFQDRLLFCHFHLNWTSTFLIIVLTLCIFFGVIVSNFEMFHIFNDFFHLNVSKSNFLLLFTVCHNEINTFIVILISYQKYVFGGRKEKIAKTYSWNLILGEITVKW